MSEYESALDFLIKAEGGEAHKQGIIAYVKALTEESKEEKRKARELAAKVKRLQEATGGTEEDLESAIANLQKQNKELSAERDELKTSSQAAFQELEKLKVEKAALDKETRLTTLAQKAGADKDAFKQLFGDANVELIGEIVTVKEGDKSISLEEYLQTQPAWKKAALFTVGQGSDNQPNKLPGAPPSPGGKEEVDAGDKYLSARFSTERFKKS
jgi:predicted RNase H-like nuclease (RuvC/YqgF family)